MRNINLIPEFERRPSKKSLRPSAPLAMLICHPACCVVLYTWQQGSHVFKDQFDGNGKIPVLTFQFNFFLLFPF